MTSELERRIKDAAATETSELSLENPRVKADQPVPIEAPTRSRRTRWGVVALAAAAALVVAVVGVNLAGTKTHITTGPGEGAPKVEPYFMPSTWPDGVDGSIETAKLADLALSEIEGGATLLKHDGVVAVLASVATTSLDPGSADGPYAASEGTLEDGRRVTVLRPEDGGITLFVELGENRTLFLWSVVVDESALRSVAESFESPSGSIDPTALPEGWAVVDDPEGVAVLGYGGQPSDSTPWSALYRYGTSKSGSFGNIALLTRTTRSADKEVARMKDLAGDEGHAVQVGAGNEGVIVGGMSAGIRTLIWTPVDGVMAVLSAEGISDDEVVAVAASLKEISKDEWNSYRMEIPELDDELSEMCMALADHPEGLTAVTWSNGFTKSEATWGVVLSFDLLQLGDESLAAVATAVTADEAGYERLRSQVDERSGAALDRMLELAMNPASLELRRGSPAVEDDAAVVSQLGGSCGFA